EEINTKIKKFIETMGKNGARAFLRFDGIYQKATIWVNNKFAFHHNYGFGPFEVDITPFINTDIDARNTRSSPDKNTTIKNQILIRVNNEKQPSLRWYSGSGIIRPVVLVIKPSIYIPWNGVAVSPEVIDFGARRGKVNISTEIAGLFTRPNANDKDDKGSSNNRHDIDDIKISFKISDDQGNVVKEASVPLNYHKLSPNNTKDQTPKNYDLFGHAPITIDYTIELEDINLWDAQHPNLYYLEVRLKYKHHEIGRGLAEDDLTLKDLDVEDIYKVKFGFRKVEFGPNGFYINGKSEKLKGVCLHHDGGCVGAAILKAVWRRRLRVLKSMGCNAIRTSHNIPSREFIELCDEEGFYVIAEAFDKWIIPKPKYGYGGLLFLREWRSELYNFIRRDRNSPSIIIWSLGNEVAKATSRLNSKLYINMYEFVKSLDESHNRPITFAFSPNDIKRFVKSILKKGGHKLVNYLDVISLNYGEKYLKTLHEHLKDKAFIITEAHHWYRDKLPEETHLRTSEKYPDCTERNPWYDVQENEFCLGQFLWAGIEYLGEVNDPYPYHGRTNAPIGICGFKKPQAGFHESVWKDLKTSPFVHLAVRDDNADIPLGKKKFDFPKLVTHWNFEGYKNKEFEIWTFTNCPKVELLLNGRSFGTKDSADYPYNRMSWKVKYQPGKLEVLGKDKNDNIVAESVLNTAERPFDLEISPDKNAIKADGKDCAQLVLQVVDKNGIIVPFADVEFEIQIDGPGILFGVDNGDLSDFTEFRAYLGPRLKAYWGKAFAIIQSQKNREGIITIKINTTHDLEKVKEISISSKL
ncbi:MAG: glycoside hydrolase family 2 protein, partial [Promethearchaeota archaeon]